jgi:hypothetical protein
MTADNIVQKIKRLKPMSKRPIERPKTRWEDDVLGDIRSMSVNNWKKSHRIEIEGRRWFCEPEPYTGCSASKEVYTAKSFV